MVDSPVHGAMGRRIDRYLMVDPLNYFSFQPVLHEWHNKDHGIYAMLYAIC